MLQETNEQIEASLRPKVLGAWTLHQLLKDRPGTLFVSSSSVNAFFGGRAVGAYAAANAFLEAFAHYQRVHCGLQSYCLSWSMWDEIGMSRGYQLKAFSQAQGFQSISPAQGWYSLLAVLHHSLPTVLVGLDGANAHIRPWLTGPGYALQEAVAYVAPAVTTPWPAWWGAQPANYRVLTRTSLPSTETGAVDVARLGGLQPSGSLLTRQEPRSALERQIRDIWAQVLKQPQIGVLDNFFELGGHSLLATQVVARMQQAFQVEIPVRQLFESPTIAELAQVLEQQQPSSDTPPPLQRVARDQKIPLSFAQQRLWFLNQLEPDSSFYNMPAALRLEGPLSVDALKHSWKEIIQRHEVLRTTFGISDGEAVQRIVPEWEEQEIFSLLDLSQWPEEEREQEARRWNKQEALQIFDLTRGPLVRMRVLKLGADNHLLLITMHHIISDGWSLGIFIEELTTLYNALVQGKPVALPPLPIQYADFAVWQNEWLKGDLLEKELTYWREQLAGMPEVIELPLDHARPTIQSYQGDRQSTSFSAELTQRVRELSQQEEVTMFMALLTSFVVLLWRYSGQEDIVVGTPIANRNRLELEGLIGFFANTLILRTSLTDDPTFREVLERVKEVTLNAYSHQDVPFEKLVEVLRPERKTSYAPLVQVMFASPPSVSEQHELTGLTIHGESTGSETSNFDLICYTIDDGQELEGQLTYNKDLFETDTIQRLLSHWVVVLEHMVSGLDQKIGSFPLVTKDELEQFISPWKELENDDE
ncbi:hypothetical protein KSC_090880 [Ktedonobacter sp. SOSP1-52]|nr:hypothetical protein KSC_090880 [Ktedonobacter sp. SOSP1-52]